MGQRICSVSNCESPRVTRGWCRKHYQRWQRLGRVGDDALTWAPVGAACSYCEGPVPPGGKYRRWCSSGCADAERRNRPKSKACAQCGIKFSLIIRHPSGRLVKAERAMCDSCVKPSHLSRFVDKLIARDGGMCQLCDQLIDLGLKYPNPLSASVDHKIPRALGGPNDIDNYQLAHFICNARKQHRVDLNQSHFRASARE